MLNDNYWYQCPLCYQSYGANDEMDVYDEEYDEDICKHCKKELDAERSLSSDTTDTAMKIMEVSDERRS